ncbi:MAG: lytic murein transglycosylase [Desulfamplus sp.]|nr:lytic murein transglycosylase [Desulfamplus sp.]
MTKKNIYNSCGNFILSSLLLPLVVISSFLYLQTAYGDDTQNQNQFNTVKDRLIKDGFSVEDIGKIYSNPKVSPELKGVSLFFVHSESKLNYDQFLSDKSINSALAYLKNHEAELDNAESIYGVDKTVITAIMLVETRLGTYLGNRAVINILSTMSSLSESSQRERLWNFLSDQQRIARDKFDKKVDSKSAWAYQELKSLLKYSTREGIDPVEIQGSYAGAMGIAQFMPSNALTLAKDGDLDGKVNLFNHVDAMHSIANYLKHHGWQPDVDREQARKVLYKYNHSNVYVDTLLKISDRLKG